MLIKIFFIAFFLNLLYEILHSLLYLTCLEAPSKKYVYLIIKGAIFDGFSITIIYLISLFPPNNLQILVFLSISLIFAYAWEVYSLKKKKWEYSEKMPKVFGVGLTPLIQLALTGIISVYLSYYLS